MGKAGAGNILRMAVRSICHILRNGEAYPEYGGLRIICCEIKQFIRRAPGETCAQKILTVRLAPFVKLHFVLITANAVVLLIDGRSAHLKQSETIYACIRIGLLCF